MNSERIQLDLWGSVACELREGSVRDDCTLAGYGCTFPPHRRVGAPSSQMAKETMGLEGEPIGDSCNELRKGLGRTTEDKGPWLALVRALAGGGLSLVSLSIEVIKRTLGSVMCFRVVHRMSSIERTVWFWLFYLVLLGSWGHGRCNNVLGFGP